MTDRSFSITAYCDARARLPVDLFVHLAGDLIHRCLGATEAASRWCGHRVFLIDGTGISMPDTPALQRRFGQPQGEGKPGFPVMHVLALMDLRTGLLADLMAARWNTHDLKHAGHLHPSLRPGDVLVGDRAFASYAHLAMLQMQGIFGVFRMHQRKIVDFACGSRQRVRSRSGRRYVAGLTASRHVRTLGREDQIVEYRRPERRPVWMSEEVFAALPETLLVRELRYQVRRRGFRTTSVTLVTTLIDAGTYSKESLQELYRLRWRIETDLRHLKQTMGLDVLKCKSVDGVMKELWAFVIVYNLVRMTMIEAARRQGVAPDRISFIDALNAMRYAEPSAPLPVLVVNPLRHDRDEPRVIKRPKDRYSYMTRPREQLRKTLGISRIAA